MLEVALLNGRTSTRVAFGCGGLGGSTGWAASRKLVVSAWDAGIRHFDVAPSYGFGEAELFLGRALCELGPEPTVTTKVGIGRGVRPKGAHAILRSAARSALSLAPGVRRWMGDKARSAAPRQQFETAAVRASVEESLVALRREHIDILLLHEAEADNVSEELLATLTDLCREGKIGEAGIGSAASKLNAMTWPLPDSITVAQCEWRLNHENFAAPSGVRVNRHGALRNLSWLRDRLTSSQGLSERLENLTGIDCMTSSGAVTLLLSLAASDAPGGQVIAQSREPERIPTFTRLTELERSGEVLRLLRENV